MVWVSMFLVLINIKIMVKFRLINCVFGCYKVKFCSIIRVVIFNWVVIFLKDIILLEMVVKVKGVIN